MGSYQQKVKSFDFVLKVIKETSMYKKTKPQEPELTVQMQKDSKSPEFVTIQTPDCSKLQFGSLSIVEKGILRRRCVDYLNEQRRSTLLETLCIMPTHQLQRPLHNTVFELIGAIKSRCLDVPAIFRREGDRETYRGVVKRMTRGEVVDFGKYDVLVLGSALKSYIRDYLDGFFESDHFEVVARQFDKVGEKEKEGLCSCLVFSLSPDKYRCFQTLLEVFDRISTYKVVTKMSHESICNIFSLTMTPGSVFKSTSIVPTVVEMFKMLFRPEIEEISRLSELIKIR